MKLDQEEKPIVPMESSHAGEIQSSSRRGFIQKSSTAALITTLAAQPVWGRCTVSGAMSGGSATQSEEEDPCRIPDAVGPSPQFWVAAAAPHPGRGQGNNGNSWALRNAFPSVEDLSALRCYIDDIRSQSFYTVPATPDSPSVEVNVGQALSSPGGIQFQLAAIWLNAHFGFFIPEPLPGRDETSPQDWVEHFYILSLVDDGDLGDLIFNSVFDDGATTQWNEIPSGYACN